ncbi:MAG: hypothetical protein ICV51_14815 [Flavisolibacter sp.]|nr:hypothetical protein [Flavisolibacter sp.]MBD0376888.1 hypothetical protein [Flavisolibacter sp.]
MKKLFFFFLLSLSLLGEAQNVKGYWYGTASVKNGSSTNNYIVELILNQSAATVQGIINYYFRNTYRSFKINGAYLAGSRQLQLYNIPITYFGSTSRLEVDCQMDFIATLRAAKAGSNLIGRFAAKPQYRVVCPEVFFDLQLNNEAKNQDSILTALREFKETYQLWTPSATDTAISAVVLQRPITNYVVINQYKEREKNVMEEIIVNADSVRVDFYDNGEIDGDSISIFFNDKLLASSQRLSTKAIHLDLALDNTREVNEITMFADNLGSIPPNTALMILYDGKKRYEVRLTSTLQTSGTIRIKRDSASASR